VQNIRLLTQTPVDLHAERNFEKTAIQGRRSLADTAITERNDAGARADHGRAAEPRSPVPLLDDWLTPFRTRVEGALPNGTPGLRSQQLVLSQPG
jgi:hypothetical protein